MKKKKLTNAEMRAKTNLKSYEVSILQRHAHFPIGTKRVPGSMQSPPENDNDKIERWLAAMDRLRLEMDSA
ncbi:hypothetical protein ACXHXM_26195